MISAFGVEHGEIAKRDRRSQADHDKRMAGTLGVTGGLATGLAAGSGAVGVAERHGRDPMGFAARETHLSRPIKGAARKAILKPMADAHMWQAKTLGGLGAASLGLAGAYHYKRKKALKPVAKKMDRDRATNAALDTGAAGVGVTALHFGGKHGNMLRQQAKHGLDEARGSHHLLAGHKLKEWELTPSRMKFNKERRVIGARVAGVKGAGAAAALTTAAAGGAGLYELGRHHLGRKHVSKRVMVEEHPEIAKKSKIELAATGAKIANKAGYPTKVKDMTVGMRPDGQTMEVVEHEGRKGSWAFHPSGTKRNFTYSSAGKGHTYRGESKHTPLKMTRKGKIAAGATAGAAYGGLTVAENKRYRKNQARGQS
jgi:hypothetical protein